MPIARNCCRLSRLPISCSLSSKTFIFFENNSFDGCKDTKIFWNKMQKTVIKFGQLQNIVYFCGKL